MYSGYGGSPSRTLSTMSLSVRPARRLNTRSITRSQSFAGVNTSDKTYRTLSVFGAPGLSRKPSRASRMFTMSKANPPPKVPQPERLDLVYEALKKGLQSYLQIHQVDLDSLSRQMKESKRNSRLGFLYELDKQVKVTERYIRRLEFHLSKIEELYDAYCLHRRLRDGASKMVKAYTASQLSKEARESLAEANKGYKEYTENMCLLESDLENQLGEFHIRMKGLAGFARLCAGDQYEIFMKYGRQRWKLRGRIEINGKQVWDSEDMVFVPLVSDFLSVKVTELKSLANHVVVGSVSCETKDLFAALPQTVAVDINDLGTIKLSLEVTWNPFDKDDQGSVASTVNKAPTVSKRMSTIFNQSPPDTPSLREQAFYNMLRRHEEVDNGTAWSNSSESSDDSSSPRLSVGGLRNSTQHKSVVVMPDIQPAASGSSSPQPDISFFPRDSASSTPNSTHKVSNIRGDPNTSGHRTQSDREEEEGAVTVMTSPDGEEEDAGKRSSAAADGAATIGHASRSYSRSLSHISENSADGVVVTDRSADSGEAMSSASGLSVNDIEMELPGKTPPSGGASNSDTSPAGLVTPDDVEDRHGKQLDASGAVPPPSPPRTKAVDSSTPSQMNTQPPPEGNTRPESGDVSYVARRVEVEEDTAAAGADRLSGEGDGPVDSGLEDALTAVVSSMDDYRGQFPELQLLEQELQLLQVTLKGGRHSRSPSVVSLTVETALCSFDFLNTSDGEEEEEEKGKRRKRSGRSLRDRDWTSPTSPLTTGCTPLDRSLVVHLENCSTQLLVGQRSSVRTLIPQLGLCLGAVSLWQQCMGPGSVYSVSADGFLETLSTLYSGLLPERAGSMAHTGGSRDGVTVTLFQLWSYLEANSVIDMETLITELAEEVWLVQSLASCDQEVIVPALRRPAECSLRREGLHAVAKLLKDPRGKVSASASSVLRSLAAQPPQREQALVSCLELLEDEHVDTRVCGCKALACLKAKESIDQLVYLCRTDKDEVRDAAKQALLVLGEEGKMAFRHVETSQDGIPRLFAPGSMASTAF
ncbi:Protein FAM65A [Liparis tanakae]|uniref:Protein FAM65A n=1 Tax=Liparis tanakae TaxID=230148 RepID=A0A4Z2FCC8_9TELE|nr:Protein FAM65A [Liparis tanakae]